MKRIAFAAALLVLPLIAHCGSSDNASISSTSGQSNMAVGIQLPSGFTYDPATGAISGEFARTGASNPKAYVGQAYITQIDVTRTGGTLASETISLTGTPPQTSASFTVTPGEAYYFSASIYTNQPAPWNVLSGGTLSPVTAPSGGHTASVDIYIPGVNGVPVVTFTADNMNPGAGTANLTCTSSDPDADPVTYLIKTVAPPAGANTLSNSNPTPGAAIAYTTGIASQVDLECVATDSYGAIGYGKLSLNYGAVAVPTAPTGVTATAGDAKVTVSWSASTGATSYNIYWSATPGVTTASNKIAGGSSPYVHAGLTNGAVYYYAVTAVNSVGESGLSAEISATPTAAVTAPTAPTTILISGGANSVSMTWSPVANATSYNLYWSTTPGVTTSTGTKIANVGTYNSTYNDYAYNHAGLTAGTTYYYILTAVNSAGESAPSPESSATPTAALQPPAPPTGVTATAGDIQVTVTWSPVAGATQYNLYWSSTSPVTMASNLIPVVVSPYIHTGRVNGTPYYYAVTAVNTAGESALSVEVNATPQPPGVVWTAQVSGTANALYGVTFSGAQFVAVGTAGTILTSPDGVAWTTRVSGTGNILFGVTWSGAQFVAVGTAGTILTSPDGVAWTTRASGTGVWLISVTWSGTKFVVVGTAGTILTSPDGVTWTAQASGTAEHLRGVTWYGTQFMAVGDLGTILTSPDGVTWTAQVSGTGSSLLVVTWSGTQFVAVGIWGTISTSPDGVTWTAQASGTGNGLEGVTWSGTQSVAVGEAGTILTSPDGVTWTARVSGTANWLIGVTWSGTKFVVVGDAGTILTSQ